MQSDKIITHMSRNTVVRIVMTSSTNRARHKPPDRLTGQHSCWIDHFQNNCKIRMPNVSIQLSQKMAVHRLLRLLHCCFRFSVRIANLLLKCYCTRRLLRHLNLWEYITLFNSMSSKYK